MQTHVSQSVQLNVMAPMRTVYIGNCPPLLIVQIYVLIMEHVLNLTVPLTYMYIFVDRLVIKVVICQLALLYCKTTL